MENFKAPDLNAPRYSVETTKIDTPEFFKRFKEKYPEYKDIEDKELKKIIKLFNQRLWETAIDYRDGVKLPELIGWLIMVNYNRSKKKNIDFKKSIKYGKIIENKNWETDGKLGKIYFTSYGIKYKMKNREFWSFTPCRNFKRTFAKKYVDNWRMYVDGERYQIKEEYKKHILKNKIKYNTNKALRDYNEFDL